MSVGERRLSSSAIHPKVFDIIRGRFKAQEHLNLVHFLCPPPRRRPSGTQFESLQWPRVLHLLSTRRIQFVHTEGPNT